MSTKKKTTEQFKAELALIQPDIEVLGEYVNTRTKILVRDIYGECNVKPSNLLEGKAPSILTALDKTAYVIAQFKEVHGDTYTYDKVEYVNARTKVVITCPIHGDFKQTPDGHLVGYGCKKCGDANKGVGGKGCYNLTTAERNRTEWMETPAIVYKIECWNDTERFIKIGITMQTVKKRFAGCIMPYNYKILQELHVDLYEAIYMEEQLHRDLKEFSYKPKIEFGGHTECFNY